jgi:VirK protein
VQTRFLMALIAIVAASNLAAGAANAKAESTNQYQQLHAQLFSGVRTTAIFSPSQCRNSQQAQATAPIPMASGGFAIRDFMEVNGNTIAFANEHFTVRPHGAAVLEFIQYRVLQNDSATVTVRSLSPTTYQPVDEPKVFQCALGDGLRFVYAAREHD